MVPFPPPPPGVVPEPQTVPPCDTPAVVPEPLPVLLKEFVGQPPPQPAQKKIAATANIEEKILFASFITSSTTDCLSRGLVCACAQTADCEK